MSFVKRRAQDGPSSTQQPSPKRQKRIPDDTGRIATAAVLAEHAASSSSSLSIRHTAQIDGLTSVPLLTSIASQVIIDNFHCLFLSPHGQIRTEDEDTRNAIAWMHLLQPKYLTEILRSVLDATQEITNITRISVPALATLFLRSGKITSFRLPPLFFRAAQPSYDPENKLWNDPENVLSNISGRPQEFVKAEQVALRRANEDRIQLFDSLKTCTGLRSLSLIGQSKLEDTTLADLLELLPLLQDVNLKGCTSVGDLSVRAVAKGAGLQGNLRILNLNYTAVSLKGLKSLLARAKKLEVLKLANVNGLTDAGIVQLLDPSTYIAGDFKTPPLSNLINLKLRSTKISDTGLRAILRLCPKLTTLDISYTQMRSLEPIANAMADSSLTLQKLCISGLQMRQNALERFFRSYAALPLERRLPLKTLKMGTLDLDNSQFTSFRSHLRHFLGLERVSLFGNTKLALGLASALTTFISEVGRDCLVRQLSTVQSRVKLIFPKSLDLSHIPIKSRDLVKALVPYKEEVAPSRLRVLVLDNTHIGDDACFALSSLGNLEELHLEQSKITVEGLSQIMEGCPMLRVLNLKGCRGIPLNLRRDWFELYEKGETRSDDPNAKMRRKYM